MLRDHDKTKHFLIMTVIRNIVYGRVMIDKTFFAKSNKHVYG